jgi:tRNA (mo5U34)-methyltransferase
MMDTRTREQMRPIDRIQAISPWHHSIKISDDIVTPGGVPNALLERNADIFFAYGVKGLSVLDVGAWDGFNSFAAEKRGASRVLAVDWFCWGGPGVGKREAFLLARELLGSKVEDRILDIPDTTVENVGKFDVVLFNGIFYHIIDPIHALLEMSRIAKRVLVVETHVDNLDNPRPVMVFYPGEKAPSGHPQNGWGPNPPMMTALLKRLGFETVIEVPDYPPNHVGPARSTFLAFKPGHGLDLSRLAGAQS